MPVYLKDDQLMDLFLATVFREAGYIAGVPRRYIEGRGGIYQIPLLLIDRSLSALNNSNVLIPKIINGDYDKQWEQVLWLNGVVADLQEARPRNFLPLPDIGGQSVGEYFHKLYGGIRNDGEFLSVNYNGIVIAVNGEISPKIKQYAVSKGMLVMHLPAIYYGRFLNDWLISIKNAIFSSFKNNIINIKGLLHHTRKISDYRNLLKKIRRQNHNLGPDEFHDLLTIFYALLKEESLRPLQNYLRKLSFALLDSQPVLVQIDNITTSSLIMGISDYYYEIAKKHKSRNLLLPKRLGFKGEVNKQKGDYLYNINLYPDENYHTVPDILKDIKLTIFVTGEQVDNIRNKKAPLSITVKEGLTLTVDISIVK